MSRPRRSLTKDIDLEGRSFLNNYDYREDPTGALLQGIGGRALSAGAGVLKGVGSLLGWAVLPIYFAFSATSSASTVNLMAAVISWVNFIVIS